jgi:hypothetical protein
MPMTTSAAATGVGNAKNIVVVIKIISNIPTDALVLVSIFVSPFYFSATVKSRLCLIKLMEISYIGKV